MPKEGLIKAVRSTPGAKSPDLLQSTGTTKGRALIQPRTIYEISSFMR